MSQFNIDEIEKRTLSGLKDFQRATVERVDYLFRHNQNRVLVADEVGMGKTLIARGAIVKTARLRIEEKDDLFKVIYICSNQNIANQNIRKLNVTGKNAIGSVSDTRLSMQHLKITEQENDPQIKEGFIQLIPLTPETSFRMTTGGGSVQERALMYVIFIYLQMMLHAAVIRIITGIHDRYTLCPADSLIHGIFCQLLHTDNCTVPCLQLT